MRKNDRFLSPRTLQTVGLLLLIGFAVFWAITGKESVLLVGAAGSLTLLGGYERARQELERVSRPAPEDGSDGERPE